MNQIRRLKLPSDVEFIIKELNKAGYEAYAVGGCVRDILLNRKPKDWDITTSASPWEVKKLFQRTVDTGLQHGTVTVMLHRVGYEVTTYRIDGEYKDGRHPKEVIFTKNLTEDLKRRDFTINAMAYNEKSGIVDQFNGMQDLQKKVIRCVGDAKERFQEDALRMLRAVRFAAQLGFRIEEKTEEAIGCLADTLEKVSRERIQVELSKLLISKYPECIKKVYQLRLSPYALPDTEEFCKGSVQDKVIRMLKYLPADLTLRWAGFLSFYTKASEGERVLRGLKFDNHTVEYVSKLIQYLPQQAEPEEKKIRYALYEMGEKIYPLYLVLKKAELMAEKEKGEEGEWLLKEKQLKETEYLYDKILERGDCISLKMLAVTGKDLMEEGIPAGKKLGRLLNQLLYRVLAEPSENERDTLLAILAEMRRMYQD